MESSLWNSGPGRLPHYVSKNRIYKYFRFLIPPSVADIIFEFFLVWLTANKVVSKLSPHFYQSNWYKTLQESIATLHYVYDHSLDNTIIFFLFHTCGYIEVDLVENNKKMYYCQTRFVQYREHISCKPSKN